MAFHDRKRELALLDNVYTRPDGQMFVLYGRRRVGKTALVAHWLDSRQHPALFWTADRTSSGAQLRSLSRAIQNHLYPTRPLPIDFTYGSWETVFSELARLADTQRIVIVLDEFTYLIEAEPALTSVLQRMWDHQLKRSNLMLILTGSHAGMIEREVLAYRSPLYNRATSNLHLQPLPFGALRAFFPKYSAEDRANIYACVGGVPQYLELLDPGRPVDWNIQQLLSSTMIMDDAGALLRDQLGEPRNYVAIVEAIASGFTRMTEIAKMAGLQQSNVGKYLDVLQHLGIIERNVPATISRPERSKQGRYRIIDHYLRFYYRFIAPARTSLERGLIQQAWQNIRKHLPEFVGTYIFEELCREWVLRQGDAGHLPFVPRRVGAFWGAGKPQVDVVAINEDDHAILLGECKWLTEPMRASVARDFLARAQRVIPAPAERWQVTYALFSKSGFTDEARQAAANVRCLWVDFDQIDADLRQV
jgi:AAA+ ATPase superfamily predicted ATPase